MRVACVLSVWNSAHVRCHFLSVSHAHCSQEFPPTSENNWFQKKIDVLRPYKFYLAFDNTDSWDYVSEKFFHGLVAGSVPGAWLCACVLASLCDFGFVFLCAAVHVS